MTLAQLAIACFAAIGLAAVTLGVVWAALFLLVGLPIARRRF